jgi:hypothetical protein
MPFPRGFREPSVRLTLGRKVVLVSVKNFLFGSGASPRSARTATTLRGIAIDGRARVRWCFQFVGSSPPGGIE